MARFGYTIMGEQAGPAQLVRDAARAEEVGFDSLAASDHYNPWLEEQGHSPYTWSVLGAVAQATESIDLMTYVTCPIIRYHPVIVAQKAATVSVLSDGRFTLGIGAGERLNEHVVGRDWPAVDIRHEMLEEAVQIMRHLLDGEHVTHRGQHFDVEDAMLWDLPDERTPIGRPARRMVRLKRRTLRGSSCPQLATTRVAAKKSAGRGVFRRQTMAMGRLPSWLTYSASPRKRNGRVPRSSFSVSRANRRMWPPRSRWVRYR